MTAALLFFVACQSAPVPEPELPARARRPESAQDRELAPYLELLGHPGLAWSGRKEDGDAREFAPDPVLSQQTSDRRAQLQAMIESYAPRIWWHPRDPFPPMDPMVFLKNCSLRYRSRWGGEKVLIPRGGIRPAELGVERHPPGTARAIATTGSSRLPCRLDPSFRPYQNGFMLNGAGYFLKYEDAALKTGRRPDVRPLGLAGKPGSFPAERVPIFWRRGSGRFAQALAEESLPGTRQMLIEYWYHVPYNWATRFELGNHQGDWEGISMLVELGIDHGRLSHRLLATYFAEHESGTWKCSREVSRGSDPSRHPEAFSAIGTHATYSGPGSYRSAVFIDRSEKGLPWDTWNLVRPLALEPYYGFSGAWGEARRFSFMTGPLVPGPGYKSLPRDETPTEVDETLQWLSRRCGSAGLES